MAIDADLSADLIDEATAKKCRRGLEGESGFFGAMDSASKFMRGDAIAGPLIVLIKIIGGIIIGCPLQGLSFGEAARTCTMKGYTVVDAATVLSTHLTELLKGNTAGMLSCCELEKLLNDLPKDQGELLKDIVPSLITVSDIQRVLQFFLVERSRSAIL